MRPSSVRTAGKISALALAGIVVLGACGSQGAASGVGDASPSGGADAAVAADPTQSATREAGLYRYPRVCFTLTEELDGDAYVSPRTPGAGGLDLLEPGELSCLVGDNMSADLDLLIRLPSLPGDDVSFKAGNQLIGSPGIGISGTCPREWQRGGCFLGYYQRLSSPDEGQRKSVEIPYYAFIIDRLPDTEWIEYVVAIMPTYRRR